MADRSQGGGTPPAKEKLEELMMLDIEYSKLDGGIFTAETGDIGLLSRKELQPQMIVGSGVGGGTPLAIQTMRIAAEAPKDSSTVGGGGPPALRLSDSDISILRDRKAPIEAVSKTGGNFLFDIKAGNTLDSVVLKDRRLKMRDSTNNQ